MSDIRREEFFVYVRKNGFEQRYNLIDMAEYWINHNNDQFWQRYDMDWPFEVGGAQEILNEYEQYLAKERGLPSISEAANAIDLIDEQIEKAKVILQKDTHAELADSMALKNNDLALLDIMLAGVMHRIEIHHPSIVGDWEGPHSRSSLEAIKQHQIDKNLFEKDPFFQVSRYRVALLSSKSILEEYIRVLSIERNSETSKNQFKRWWKSFDSRIAVMGLIIAVVAFAFDLLGGTQ